LGNLVRLLLNTCKPASRGEVYLVTGCLARTIHCLVQILYALNETYYLSEKKLEADLDSFSIRPPNFLERIYPLLGATGTTNAQLQESLAKTEVLYEETLLLLVVMFLPLFDTLPGHDRCFPGQGELFPDLVQRDLAREPGGRKESTLVQAPNCHEPLQSER
jgi:hypothetical protein